MLTGVDWSDLRIILTLQRSGSLAATGRALGVNQTTVGRRLAALQAQLGARLVERVRDGYRLTEAGRAACATAEAMEASARGLEREIGGRDSAVEGVVRITAPMGSVPLLLSALMPLRAQHAGLRFDLLVDTFALDLMKHEADIAVRMTDPRPSSLLARKVGAIRLGVFATEVYLRLRGEPGPELAEHDVIGYLPPLDRTPASLWLTEHAPRARVVLRVNNLMAAIDAAAAGLGICVVPRLVGERGASLRLLRPVPGTTHKVFLVAHPDLAQLPRVRTTLDHLARTLPPLFARY